MSETNKMVRVAIKEVNKDLEVVDIDIDGNNLRKVIGGYFEYIFFKDSGIGVLVDEDGRLKNLPVNFKCNYYGFIVGTAIFVTIDEDGDIVSLSDNDISKIKNFIKINKL